MVDVVKVIVVQAVDDDNGSDDAEGRALMHSKEESKLRW